MMLKNIVPKFGCKKNKTSPYKYSYSSSMHNSQRDRKADKRGAVLPKNVYRRTAAEILWAITFTFIVFLHFQFSWNAVFPARECEENSYRCSVLLCQRKWAVAL